MDSRLYKVLIPPPFHSEDPSLSGSILLDPQGYISDRTNDATADGFTKGGKAIHVTFWVADPPRASFFTVYIPEDNDYFVYQAGTKHKRPSLQRIPTPPTVFFSDSEAGLLRCRNRYLIALLCGSFIDGQYNLHLCNSKTKLSLSEGNAVQWVGLISGGGILICDLLKDSNRLHYIPLPSLVHRLPEGPPLRVRGINVFRNEYIKYFDMCLHIGSDSVTKGWEAATWRLEVSGTEWKEDCRFKVSNDLAFPNLQEDECRAPTLKGVYSGFPALSLHDDDIVYIIDKSDLLDKKASVIAVGMSNQTLKGVADFGSGRTLGYSFVYF
ncbi:hypothetical protein C2845_PM15G11660 [Panicum miliaceum]|uniref:DUF1618 domain-containing protein n=1 Tax=Panicum miliaceum TaxID=4540 RepID=A0A3L6Q7J6_PANMI|nr:hypothetical protein C2845_PM15G11660 [Panicum miliaceum]